MINKLKNIFRGKKVEGPKKYEGLSDFFMHAPADEQKKVFTEAARRANEDQMKVFKQAQEV
ncbi:MAG: hypothetical protein WC648_03025 [Candidatus Paceibacterota bacterium]|jgi:hypothetical protein